MSGDESPLDQTTLTACGAVFGLTAAEMAELTEDSGPHYRPTRCMHEGEAGFRYCGADAERVLFGITMCLDHWNKHLDNLRNCSDIHRSSDVLSSIVSAVRTSLGDEDEVGRTLGLLYLEKLARSGVDIHTVTALELLEGAV